MQRLYVKFFINVRQLYKNETTFFDKFHIFSAIFTTRTVNVLCCQESQKKWILDLDLLASTFLLIPNCISCQRTLCIPQYSIITIDLMLTNWHFSFLTCILWLLRPKYIASIMSISLCIRFISMFLWFDRPIFYLAIAFMNSSQSQSFLDILHKKRIMSWLWKFPKTFLIYWCK